MSKKNKVDKDENINEQEVDQATATLDQEETSNEANTTEDFTPEEQLQEQVAAEKEKFMRLFAEFENYKKRTSKERVDMFRTANQEVMLAMLPIIDDFERALKHLNQEDASKSILEGVELIYHKLMKTLEQKGLSKIEVAQGDTFNADDHEAVTQIAAPSEDLKGKIIDVIEKGYKLGEKVIRFPKVVIGQ